MAGANIKWLKLLDALPVPYPLLPDSIQDYLVGLFTMKIYDQYL
jgi:hypothetical protein